jgi:peptidoglycan hydrolase-like protein with peptidoglycan-binding domain
LGALEPADSLAGIQARLNNLGFEAGPVDGIMGPKTRRGLNAFRRAHEMPESNSLDETTQKKIVDLHGT